MAPGVGALASMENPGARLLMFSFSGTGEVGHYGRLVVLACVQDVRAAPPRVRAIGCRPAEAPTHAAAASRNASIVPCAQPRGPRDPQYN
jgi:hypothetical protein